MLLLEALRAGHGIAILDFEMGPHAAVTLLRELGATTEELQQIQYTEPDRPPTPADIARIVGLGTGYTLIDAAAGAYDTSGLDDNSRKDAETFAAQWIRPLWQAGVATIVIDHVTKDTQTRGKFAIGSERKTGQADVHLSLEALKPLHRGSTGLVKIHVHKDRPGHLPRPTAYIVDLTSDHEHHITWTLREPLQTTEDGFRHTIYMERISRHMEKQPDHHFTKNELETDVQGRAELVRTALLEMVEDGYVTVVETHLKYPKFTLVRPFVPSSSHVVPDEVVPPRPNSSPPYRGTTDGTDEPDDPKTQNVVPPEIDVYDPNLQALLDDNIPF
jgi:hypothetical protein